MVDDTERQEGVEDEEEPGSDDETESQEDFDDDDEEQSSKGDTDDEEDDDDDDEELDPQRLYKTVKNQRRVEKDLKARVRELEGQASELEKIKKAQRKQERESQGETERLQSDLEDVQKERDGYKSQVEKYQQKERRYNFLERMEARGLTKRQAKYAWSQRDEIGTPVKFDKEDRVQNEKALVKAYRDHDPEFFKIESADGGDRGSRRRTGDMNSMIRQMAGRE